MDGPWGSSSGNNNPGSGGGFSGGGNNDSIDDLLKDLKDTGLKLKDLKTEQSTLEKIFVNLVKENNEI